MSEEQSLSIECPHRSVSEERMNEDGEIMNKSTGPDSVCERQSDEKSLDKSPTGVNDGNAEAFSLSSEDDDDDTIYLCGNEVPGTASDSLNGEGGAKDFEIVSPKDLQQSLDESRCLKKVLFRNHLAEPLSFLLLLHDFGMEMKLSKLIEECGGLVYGGANEIDDYTIVLVKDDSIHWAVSGPVFKVSYITACVKAKRLINISKFFKGSLSPKFPEDYNHMDVVYFKKHVWYDEQNDSWSSVKKEQVVCVSDTGSSDDDIPLKTQSLSQGDGTNEKCGKKKAVNKHSRLPYTRQEVESIIKYIVKKRGYDRLKGVAFWKEMESREVCPKRTWQSMKEHFRRKIVFNLRGCKIISEKQRELLERSCL